MIGIDTNVLVRYFVEDDPKQRSKATKYLEENCSVTDPGFITSIVLCELVWVLDSNYNYTKKIITDLLSRLLTTAELLIEHQEEALQALRAFEKGNADFSDYYIAHIADKYNVTRTITFDKKAAQYKLFEFIG